jgi:hypothetical protein
MSPASKRVTGLADITAQPPAPSARSSLVKLGKRLPRLAPGEVPPDWVAANPRHIEKALARARTRPTGGWFVVGESRVLLRKTRRAPTKVRIAGTEFVLWADDSQLHVAPNACPHMGARLDKARVCEGKLVCPWHGLELGAAGRGAWQCLPVHDDGVLFWVRLPEAGQQASAAPFLPPRPEHYLDGVIELEARCEPDDVVANRLDPWHGVHLHPYGFAELAVTEAGLPGEEDRMLMRVAKRILGPVCVEVDISFHVANARCIVMTILEGEGAGSVVETHATPVGRVDGMPQCRIVEATLASSDREGFRHATKLAGLFRPFIRRSALSLWTDDLPYAERLYEIRGALPRGGSHRDSSRESSHD